MRWVSVCFFIPCVIFSVVNIVTSHHMRTMGYYPAIFSRTKTYIVFLHEVWKQESIQIQDLSGFSTYTFSFGLICPFNFTSKSAGYHKNWMYYEHQPSVWWICSEELYNAHPNVKFIRYEVFTAIKIQFLLFWTVTPSSDVVRGSWRNPKDGSSKSAEMSVSYHMTKRCHNPKYYQMRL